MVCWCSCELNHMQQVLFQGGLRHQTSALMIKNIKPSNLGRKHDLFTRQHTGVLWFGCHSYSLSVLSPWQFWNASRMKANFLLIRAVSSRLCFTFLMVRLSQLRSTTCLGTWQQSQLDPRLHGRGESDTTDLDSCLEPRLLVITLPLINHRYTQPHCPPPFWSWLSHSRLHTSGSNLVVPLIKLRPCWQ